MVQLGYRGFYCMGVWSFTMHNVMKKTRVLFVLFTKSMGGGIFINFVDDVRVYERRVTGMGGKR